MADIQYYENFVLQNKMEELTNTHIQTNALYTVDDSLQKAPGMKKIVNKYKYSGKVEKLSKGQKNSVMGSVTYEPSEYDITRHQQTFNLKDEDVMSDPYLIDVAMKGASEEMSNEIRSDYFVELAKISNEHEYEGAISYNTVVDGLLKIDKEVESDLFLVISLAEKAELRKDEDFKASKQGEILYTGQIGTVCGVPVICSRLVPEDTSYITNKEAVTLFLKKDVETEQERHAHEKDTDYIFTRYSTMALTDETKSVKLVKKAS